MLKRWLKSWGSESLFLVYLGSLIESPTTTDPTPLNFSALWEMRSLGRSTCAMSCSMARDVCVMLLAIHDLEAPSSEERSGRAWFRSIQGRRIHWTCFFQRTPWGGWNKDGRKTSGHPLKTPLSKGFGFGPPSSGTFSHPPQVSLLCFSSTRIQEGAGQKLFWRALTIFRERVLWYVFLPHTCVFQFEPQSQTMHKTAFFVQKVRTFGGARSGIGRNPTFCADLILAVWAPWLELKYTTPCVLHPPPKIMAAICGQGHSAIRRPLKTTFVIFSTGGCPSHSFYSFDPPTRESVFCNGGRRSLTRLKR